jgi:hypothetical protein
MKPVAQRLEPAAQNGEFHAAAGKHAPLMLLVCISPTKKTPSQVESSENWSRHRINRV